MDSKYGVPIFNRKVDIWNCSCYGAVKLLEHGIKVVERVLGERLFRLVNVSKMHFGFMSERGAIVDDVWMMWG